MGRQVRWPAERQYAEETKALVHGFIHEHPFVPTGFLKWECSIPEGQYRITEGGKTYLCLFFPFIGKAEHVLEVSHVAHKEDAWARVAIAVTRDANRRMQ